MKKLFGMMLMAVMVSGPIAQAHGGGGGYGGGYSHGSYGCYGGHGGWGWGLGLGLGLGYWAGCYSYPYYYSTPVVYAPSSAMVVTTTSASQPVVMGGVTYYTINGTTYYQTTAGLCPVAQPPQMIMNNTAAPANPPPTAYASYPVVNSSAPTIVAPAQQPVLADNPAVTMPVAAITANESYSINIPNAKAGYTAVTLKRAGTGFTGPQGEFYPEFPKVALLQVMYGK